MYFTIRTFACFLAGLIAIACSPPSSANEGLRLWQMSKPLMGTLFSIKVYAESREKAEQACSSAFEEAGKLEMVLSVHDPDSELSQLNRIPANQPFSPSPRLLAALQEAIRHARLTDGAFDPTLGACLHLWRRSISRQSLPDPLLLEQAKASSGFKHVEFHSSAVVKRTEGLKFDLGGIGKGIATDAIGRCLNNAGLTRFCISSTSDVLAGEPPPGKSHWNVSFDEKGKETFPLVNSALSTSGDKHQFVVIGSKRYSHVLNPATGVGLANSRTVTVKAPRATEADALATCFCVLPESLFPVVLARFPQANIIRRTEYTRTPPSS